MHSIQTMLLLRLLLLQEEVQSVISMSLSRLVLTNVRGVALHYLLVQLQLSDELGLYGNSGKRISWQALLPKHLGLLRSDS